jgi:catechol 2,3-dioxygenase
VKVHELGHLVLYVRDIDRSATFYSEVLGFRPVIDRPPGQRGVMYRTESDRTHHELLLIEVGPDAAPLPDGERVGLFHFGVKIGDTEAELREAASALRSAGVTITSAVDHGATRSLYVQDPDGNEIELYVDVPTVDWRADPNVINRYEPIDM